MLDLEPIKQRLAEAKRQRSYEEADRHEAKSRAWSDFYQHAPTDIEDLLAELEHLRKETEKMTPQTLATPGEYNAAPLGTVIIDEDGNAWQKTTESTNIIDGYTGSWQRAADDEVLDGLAMSEGEPSTVIYTPDPTEPPQPHNYQTAQDPEELDHLPVGTVVKDKEGDCYARVDNGWIWTEQIFNSLDSFYGPYTVIRTPSQCETPATCEDH